MSDTILHTDHNEYSLLDVLAGSLGVSVALFDREDRLLFVTDDYKRFVPLPIEAFTAGTRLRDFLGAVFDTGRRFGVTNNENSEISREEWVADQIAVHWRERHESIEKLDDGRWIKLAKRRLPGGMLITIITDISDQKRRDRDFVEMRDQADLAQHILNKLPNPVIVKDANLRYALVNNAFCELLDLPARDIIGLRAADLVGPVAGSEFEENERVVLETGEPIEYVEDLPNLDGTISRAITRKHRSGIPGAYYVTISVDRITTFTARKNTGSLGSGGEKKAVAMRRILVADEDTTRAQARVASLISSGVDALAIPDQHQLIAFLETAKSMDIVVNEVELSTAIQSALARNPMAGNYPVLTRLSDGPKMDRPPSVSTNSNPHIPSGVDTVNELAANHHLGTPSSRIEKTEQSEVNKPELQTTMQSRKSETDKLDSNRIFDQIERQTPQVSKRTRILVAEDNDVNRIVFQQILDGLDVDFKIVGNGEEAVAACFKYKPDLILMDISMPVMNGHQAARAIREEENRDGPAVNHVPIIAVTAHALAGDRDECFAAGMDDYLTKPISPEKLRSMIATWSPMIENQQKRASSMSTE